MWIDAAIVLFYFVVIMVVGIRSRSTGDVTAEEYFLSSRSLRWPSIAISTIATNISAGHFVAMAGSAYLFGLAQANFELNAVFGILIAAFIFVPFYLRARVTTITEFFEMKFGPRVALFYTVAMMVLYGLMYLGTALFWGAYAIDELFGDMVAFLGDDRFVRLGWIVVFLGVFSATYTYLGGLSAVVRTDIAQFVLLVGGGGLTLWLSISELGGWGQLYDQTGHLMHLHLPADHPELPWIGIIGMCILNLNYWGANQVILQRALAAKSLRHAQIGLLVGGCFKYVMIMIIIIPAIALVGITGNSIEDPDKAYMTLVNVVLPTGLRGIILCGLFASLMSTVDSIFNSVSTLWSIDIYKRHLKPDASDAEVVGVGKKAILVTLITGVAFGFFMIYVKLQNEDFALTHWFNAMSYVVKNAFVVLVVAAIFLFKPVQDAVGLGKGRDPAGDGPSASLVFYAMLISVPLGALFKFVVAPDMNYLIRSTFVIVLCVGVVAIPTWIRQGFRFHVRIQSSGPRVTLFAVLLGLSLIASHVIFH